MALRSSLCRSASSNGGPAAREQRLLTPTRHTCSCWMHWWHLHSHNAAHAPCVMLWDVRSAKHSIHCPCEHRCLSCADVFIHSHKQPSLHGQLGKEEIPGTEMTARAPCQYSEPDFPLFCLQVTFLFACLKIEIVKERGWRHGRKHCAMKHNILGVKWNILVVPLLFGFPWQKTKNKKQAN